MVRFNGCRDTLMKSFSQPFTTDGELRSIKVDSRIELRGTGIFEFIEHERDGHHHPQRTRVRVKQLSEYSF